MLPATASAPAPDPAALHAAYLGHLQRTGRGNTAYWTAARTFFARWPDPAAWTAEPLNVRLSANGATRPLITFLMRHRHLQPGYDYLLERKFSSLWRELAASPAGQDLTRFLDAAAGLGFSERHRTATASQVPARLVVQTGWHLDSSRPPTCYGRAAAVWACRARVLTRAYLAHPERFVRKPPATPDLPAGSWINPPENYQEKETAAQ